MQHSADKKQADPASDAHSSAGTILLPDGAWALWRWTAVRGTGFPASVVLRLAARDAAVAADALVDAEHRRDAARESAKKALLSVKREGPNPPPAVEKALRALQRFAAPATTGTRADVALAELGVAAEAAAAARAHYDSAFARDRARLSHEIRRLAADPHIREAVAWQNRAALETAFDHLQHADVARLRSNDRRHEALVARYLQRYCTKNDTIGFFGPVGWGCWTDDREAVVVRSGPQLLATRTVYFEHWPIDLLAGLLGADERLRPWMPPRRLPFVKIAGTTAESAMSGKQELTPDLAALLVACDGVRTPRELARALGWPSEGDLFDALADLRAKKLVAWAFEIPVTWKPEQVLRRLVERVDDDALRIESLDAIERLDADRRTIAQSGGDVGALLSAMKRIDSTFTDVTGAASSHRSGSMYAGRQVVFEDCRRDLDVRLGTSLLEVLAPPLSLVLTSARWFTSEVGRAYHEALRGVYAEIAQHEKATRVSFLDFWLRSQRILFGAKDRPIDAIIAELERRWATILELPPDARRATFRADDLRGAVERAFDAPGPGWRAAINHSPDVMIVADGIEAIARGDYQLVLGELHPGLNALDTVAFAAQHPRVMELHAAFERDVPSPRIRPVFPKEWPNVTVRTSRIFGTDQTLFVETGLDVAAAPREHVLAASELVVEERHGRLVVSSDRLAPLDVMEIVGTALSTVVLPSFQILAKRDHMPRVTIDRLVVARERWTVAPAELAFDLKVSEAAAFVAARRWARQRGLPRFVFVKSTLEVKPMYVDFESPLYVGMLVKIARAAKESASGESPLVLSEMLPGLDATWLSDAAGERYAAELRIVAVDRRGGGT